MPLSAGSTGRLDTNRWETLGAQWRQRSGRVRRMDWNRLRGRSCGVMQRNHRQRCPTATVTVRLKDESGAAD